MSFYQSNSLPKQWQWKPGIYFKQDGQVYRLASWLKAEEGLALVRPLSSNYEVCRFLVISAAAWRVRKDGREYKRTSRLSALARRRNANLGRLAGIKSNLLGLINHEIHEPIYQELLSKDVAYTLQAIEAQIDREWRKRKEEAK